MYQTLRHEIFLWNVGLEQSGIFCILWLKKWIVFVFSYTETFYPDDDSYHTGSEFVTRTSEHIAFKDISPKRMKTFKHSKVKKYFIAFFKYLFWIIYFKTHENISDITCVVTKRSEDVNEIWMHFLCLGYDFFKITFFQFP